MKNHKNINKNIKVVNLGILKVKKLFGDKDLFSYICLIKPMTLQILINLLIKTYYFIKTYKFINKNTLSYKNAKFS